MKQLLIKLTASRAKKNKSRPALLNPVRNLLSKGGQNLIVDTDISLDDAFNKKTEPLYPESSSKKKNRSTENSRSSEIDEDNHSPNHTTGLMTQFKLGRKKSYLPEQPTGFAEELKNRLRSKDKDKSSTESSLSERQIKLLDSNAYNDQTIKEATIIKPSEVKNDVPGLSKLFARAKNRNSMILVDKSSSEVRSTSEISVRPILEGNHDVSLKEFHNISTESKPQLRRMITQNVRRSTYLVMFKGKRRIVPMRMSAPAVDHL